MKDRDATIWIRITLNSKCYKGLRIFVVVQTHSCNILAHTEFGTMQPLDLNSSATTGVPVFWTFNETCVILSCTGLSNYRQPMNGCVCLSVPPLQPHFLFPRSFYCHFPSIHQILTFLQTSTLTWPSPTTPSPSSNSFSLPVYILTQFHSLPARSKMFKCASCFCFLASVFCYLLSETPNLEYVICYLPVLTSAWSLELWISSLTLWICWPVCLHVGQYIQLHIGNTLLNSSCLPALFVFGSNSAFSKLGHGGVIAPPRITIAPA